MSKEITYDAQFNYMILSLFKDSSINLLTKEITEMLKENKALWKIKTNSVHPDGFYNEIRGSVSNLSDKENALQVIGKDGNAHIYAQGEEVIFKKRLLHYAQKVLIEIDLDIENLYDMIEHGVTEVDFFIKIMKK